MNYQSSFLPYLKSKPFGINSSSQSINDISGIWVKSCIKALRSVFLKQNKNLSLESSFQVTDKLIENLEKVIPVEYAFMVNEEFLLTNWHSYSMEFGFILASLCRNLVGVEHTREATLNIDLPQIKEFLPLDFLNVIGAWIFEEVLLGGKIRFHSTGDSNTHLEIIYRHSIIKNIPSWKEIAMAQQEAALEKIFTYFWGVNNLKIEAKSRFENTEKQFYGFEYKITWSGGEKATINLLGSSEYLKEKTTIWLKYLNHFYMAKLGNVSEEVHKIKMLEREQKDSIETLSYAKTELEGLIQFLLKNPDKIKQGHFQY